MKTNTTTIPQITFYVACDDNLKSTVRKACAIWSDVLSGYVTLQPWEMGRVVNITVKIGDGVQTIAHPDRVAHCKSVAPDLWAIRLERGIKWAVTPWQRFWGLGEDALAAVVHELGHVFDLPHASDPIWVMHPDIGGNGKLSENEKASYRNFFIQKVL